MSFGKKDEIDLIKDVLTPSQSHLFVGGDLAASGKNPKEVKDYVELNKQHLTELWDDEKSEEENIQFLIDYFTEYPDEMNSVINPNKVKTVTPVSGRNGAPILQNIGGVKDFRSF